MSRYPRNDPVVDTVSTTGLISEIAASISIPTSYLRGEMGSNRILDEMTNRMVEDVRRRMEESINRVLFEPSSGTYVGQIPVSQWIMSHDVTIIHNQEEFIEHYGFPPIQPPSSLPFMTREISDELLNKMVIEFKKNKDDNPMIVWDSYVEDVSDTDIKPRPITKQNIRKLQKLLKRTNKCRH